MSASRSPPFLVSALVASLLLHVATIALLRQIEGSGPPGGEDALLLTDIDVAPEPPEAHEPGEDDTAPAPEVEPVAEPEPEPEPAGTLEPEPEPEPEPIVEIFPDAGVDGAVVADLVPDAGVADATALALGGDGGADGATLLAGAGDGGIDAGVAVAAAGDGGVGDGGVAVAITGHDAGPAIVAVPGDGGVAVASAGDGGSGAVATSGSGAGVDPGLGSAGAGGMDGTDREGVPPPPGAEADLLAYFPPGEVVTAMIRLDRFRGTQWAQPMQDILGPMPDYQAIVGGRQISMADLFDTLVISSPRPEDVTATSLVARHRQSAAYLRRFLDHGEAHTRWRAARGGALGQRQPSPLIARGDRRVFLMPFAGMIVLVHPRHLGKLTEKSKLALAKARAREEELPEWLRRVRTIEIESGADDGPALLLTMVGFPGQIEVPLVGAFPGPDRATVALEITQGGFLVRGNLVFATEPRAAAFVAFATEKQKSLLGSYKGRLLLAPFSAVNAVEGLSLKRKGKKVAYATSISIADGRAMLDFGARWSQAYFAAPPPPATRPGGAPPAKPPGKSGAASPAKPAVPTGAR